MFFELKEGIREKKSEDELAEQIQLSPLIDKIRNAPGATMGLQRVLPGQPNPTGGAL